MGHSTPERLSWLPRWSVGARCHTAISLTSCERFSWAGTVDLADIRRGFHELNAAGDSVVLVNINVVAEPHRLFVIERVFIDVAEHHIGDSIKPRDSPTGGHGCRPRRKFH
jgi:hypothetical protein